MKIRISCNKFKEKLVLNGRREVYFDYEIDNNAIFDRRFFNFGNLCENYT